MVASLNAIAARRGALAAGSDGAIGIAVDVLFGDAAQIAWITRGPGELQIALTRAQVWPARPTGASGEPAIGVSLPVPPNRI